MFHPLSQNLRDLKDSEVEETLQKLTQKYFIAQRLGNPQMLTQLSTFVNIYKEEMSRRLRKNTGELDGDLDQLINVD